MTDTDEFLTTVLPRQREADEAIHRGDSGPRKAFWSMTEPVSVLGAARSATNRRELEDLFDWLAETFSGGGEYEFEPIAAEASGGLGYMVGFERSRASIAGSEPMSYQLRVTLIFRREHGEWRAIHRHADPVGDSEAVGILKSL